MSRKPRLKSAVPVYDPPWLPPWHTTARWNHERERWEARIRPGLVNAMPATVSLPREEWPRLSVRRFETLGLDPGDKADIPLTEEPWLPLATFRALGSDGAATGINETRVTFEAVPEYFRLLGVGPPPDVDLTSDILGYTPPPSETRLLRACDLVLHVDRIASATQWSFGAGVDGTVAQFSLTFVRKPGFRRSAYITTSARWLAIPDRTDLLAGNVADSPTDEYHLATVYLMSPPAAPLSSAPDASWTPYVQQRGGFFWNCQHATSKPAALASQNLTLNTGLAGGVGDAINNFLLSQINDPLSAAAQFLSRGRLQSHLWSV